MSLFNIRGSKTKALYCICIFLAAVCIAGLATAKDTDIYQINAKQNCYILMDSSGSMDFGVYESSKDYGVMYDSLEKLAHITDKTLTAAVDHLTRRKVYLMKGPVGMSTATIKGKTVAFTGDAGKPKLGWYWEPSLVDTHTLIDAAGTLSWDGSGTQRLTTDDNGYILLDGERLPLGQDIKLDDWVTLYEGTRIENGFAGLLDAPGFYFSGYEGVGETHDPASLNEAESGDNDIYFFVTGNWANMQKVYNLTYSSVPTGKTNEPWRYEQVLLSSPEDWATLGKTIKYPESGLYANNLKLNNIIETIHHGGASQIQVHFSAFDVNPTKEYIKTSKWTGYYDAGDYVALYDGRGNKIVQYDNNTKPSDGWSVTINGDTVKIAMFSGEQNQGTGFQIDQIRVADNSGSYKMQTRLDSAKEAMQYALLDFHGKMNWGFAHYNNGDGAKILTPLNPNDNDDVNRNNVVIEINKVTAGGGTPMGEALQDVFEKGYYAKNQILDNLNCRKNYIISVTDGFPSVDDDWNRIAGVTFQDWDEDDWTADPFQYKTNTPPNYYDDVSHWLYTHSWMDKSEVADPANSYVNVTTHHIAFGADHPLLEDAARDSGGMYIAARNREQLVAAFYAIGLQMTEAISFTAPVVSVDAANKIQNGDDLYMGLFLPQDSQSWVGNLKKYKLGDGSTARPYLWMLYDAQNRPAINSSGEFLDNAAAFWGDDNDANDADVYGSHDVKEDGVGEVLTEQVVAAFNAGTNFYERPIFTYVDSTMTKVDQANITAAQLGVDDDVRRNEIINYVYGYTDKADAETGAPLAYRDWALGSIIHSSPVVVDYYDESDISVLEARYIVVGANDGMLHVFDDSDGSEKFAFIPPDVLPNLKLLPTTPLVDMVDGEITLYRRDQKPKYLIFGLRRGGGSYWCLDVSDSDSANWDVAWQYSNAEMVQSWAKPQVASIPVGLNSATGAITFKDIVVFTGGYDPEEDSYPEPFLDIDNNGTPYAANGTIVNAEWSKTNVEQDINNNDVYDRYNPDKNEYGRGIFAVDIDNPQNTVTLGGNAVLPFSVTFGTSNVTTGASQKLSSMKFCFPATPALISSTYSYYYKDAGVMREGKKTNVLDTVYAPDIYTNIYKLVYKFEVAESEGTYSLKENGWKVNPIFSGNPGSTSGSGQFKQGVDTSDQGRKTFYPPAVSWGGAGDYFDAGNYGFKDTTFSGQYDIASLYIGTGDREHPTHTITRNRFYAIYDDTSVTAKNTETGASVKVSTPPYTENHLLNLSCDELGESTTLTGLTKATLRGYLTDDAEYNSSGTPALENGDNENDAKGWYVILEDQGDATACSHCKYGATIDNDTSADRDNHEGEAILSKVELYAGILYFTSYQPSIQDPCNPQGNGFSYSLNYSDGTAAFNLNTDNDGNDSYTFNVTDRYKKINNIFGLPSGFSIISRKGQAGAMAMMGGRIIGPGDPDGEGDPGDEFKIPGPPLGLELYYWREGNSQQP